MSYQQSAALIDESDFRQRVNFAALKAALAILNEPPDQTHPAREDKRLSLARQVITSALATEVMVRLCAINPDIAAAGNAATDNDIDFVMSSIWDAVAGVTYTDVNTGTS